MGAGAFCWRAACQRRGGNTPAPAFPRRGKRERGSSDFLAAAGSSRWRGADGRDAAGRVCARSATTFLSITITNQYVDPLDPLARSLADATHPRAVLLSALSMGHTGPGASWGPISCPGPSHSDGPGLLGCCHLFGDLWRIIALLAVTRTRRWMSLLTELLKAGWPPRDQLMLALLPLLASGMRLLGMALPGSPASGPWPATLLPLSARHAAAAHTLLR